MQKQFATKVSRRWIQWKTLSFSTLISFGTKLYLYKVFPGFFLNLETIFYRIIKFLSFCMKKWFFLVCKTREDKVKLSSKRQSYKWQNRKLNYSFQHIKLNFVHDQLAYWLTFFDKLGISQKRKCCCGVMTLLFINWITFNSKEFDRMKNDYVTLCSVFTIQRTSKVLQRWIKFFTII